MAVLERSSFVDLGTDTQWSSMYLLNFLMCYLSFIKMSKNMKVLLESLHLNVHTQEFIQISYNHINQIKAGLWEWKG